MSGSLKVLILTLMTLLQGLKTPQFLVKNKTSEAYIQYGSIGNAKKKSG